MLWEFSLEPLEPDMMLALRWNSQDENEFLGREKKKKVNHFIELPKVNELKNLTQRFQNIFQKENPFLKKNQKNQV